LRCRFAAAFDACRARAASRIVSDVIAIVITPAAFWFTT